VHLFGQRRHDDDDAVSGAEAEHDDDEFRYGGRFITDARGYIDVPAPEDMQARCACTAAVSRVRVRACCARRAALCIWAALTLLAATHAFVRRQSQDAAGQYAIRAVVEGGARPSGTR
jgi:hypothetical protein